jgi:hypothetical protein
MERKKSAAEKVKKAFDLRLQGVPYEDIARQVGYASRGNACRAVSNWLATHPAPSAGEMRQIENLKYDLIEAGLWRIVGKVHWATCSKGLAYDSDGLPVVDDAPNVQAYRALIALYQRRARLNGLDLPSVTPASAAEEAEEDAEVEAFVAEILSRPSMAYPPSYVGYAASPVSCRTATRSERAARSSRPSPARSSPEPSSARRS